MDDVEKVTKMLKKRSTAKANVKISQLLHTGGTLLNLAATGHWQGGLSKGKYHYLVGDSEALKTFLGLTSLAEASINPRFDDYRLIFDNAEDGAAMDLTTFFGEELAKRIEPPAIDENGEPLFSETTEEFYYHVDDAFDSGRPFIYLLDSMDALDTESAEEKFIAQKKANREGKESSGSFGSGQAKINSQNIRRVRSRLRRTGSILIIISQTRDNLKPGFVPKTRSGGHALKFFADIEIWSSVVKTIKKQIKGKPRQIGSEIKFDVKKNRFNGRKRTVIIPMYHSYGIDDIGSCIDFLLDEKYWKKGRTIVAKDFDFSGSREQLIAHIEENDLERDLRKLVGQVWHEIEDACIVKRKKRYE